VSWSTERKVGRHFGGKEYQSINKASPMALKAIRAVNWFV
jgi:hypothetical protein